MVGKCPTGEWGNPLVWVGLPLFVGALLICPRLATGQVTEAPYFSTYGMEDGLSQGSAIVLLQDQIGFVWIGTQDGLNRFDGINFRAYKHSRDDSTSLSDDYILSLARAEDGRLWVGTNRGGVNLFNPQTGEATRFLLPELGPWLNEGEVRDEGREGRTVSGIVPLQDGSLILSTDAGLARFSEFMDQADPIGPADSVMVDARTSPVCAAEGGGGWVGFGDGSVRRIEPGGAIHFAFSVPDSVWVISCPRGGPGHLATRQGDIYEFGPVGEEPRLVLRLETRLDPQPRISGVVRGPEGLLWVATTQGLFLGSGASGLRPVGAGDEEPGLPSQDVLSLLIDRESGVWIGTWNGLARVNPRSRLMHRIPRGSEGQPGVSQGVISIEESLSGGLWFGTDAAGVDVLEAGWRSGVLRVSRVPELDRWPRARVLDITRGPDGALFLATLRNAVIRFDPGNQRARIIPALGPDGVPRTDALVYSIAVDHRGEVWAGTLDMGLVRYDPREDRFEEFRGPSGDWRYGSTWVWPVVEDDVGRLWVGAFEGGLNCIDVDRSEIRTYREGPGQLSDNRVFALFPDSRGDIWIGTQGGGLNRLDPETGEFTVFTEEDGIPHDHVVGIIEDDDGYIWISTNNGLARMDPTTEELWVLGENMGLAGSRFFVNAIQKLASGELAFGGPDGVTILDPARLRPDRFGPRIALTDVMIRGESVPLARALSGDGLDLEPRDNFFAFGFAALDFTDPEQNRYAYMLEGLDDDWIDALPGQMANYTAVDPGRYVFRIRGRNADGVWSEGPSVPVRVRAPFHRNPWFLSFLGLSLLSLTTFVVFGRIREQRRRLEVAGHLHDGIGASIASIIRVLGRVEEKLEPGHPGREDLRRLNSMADWAKTETQAAVKILRKGKEGESLAHLVKELRDTADWMLAGNVQDYRILAPDKLPRRTVNWKARTDAFLLVKEALNNVLKHAEATFVEVEVRYDPPNLYLRVTDDGKGFSPGARADGNGLDLMRSHSTRHGGKDPVRSVPGEGTTVETVMRIH